MPRAADRARRRRRARMLDGFGRPDLRPLTERFEVWLVIIGLFVGLVALMRM